ncbi:hypothetical protein MPSI1_001844 [Malassezia psittaci]|uniref:Transcriptional coactivator HFI1/ADA1 n=1 Tax=Malassezia psittaci TaxID=1821823 RepID=A0AAF0FB25_9BASI|nr:hypothetical protein MPSI1_001844 [Malassezia psittaci]
MAESGAQSRSTSARPRVAFDQLSDSRSIKSRLLAALGPHAENYWVALGEFCTAAIDRTEFAARVERWLPDEHLPLHNALMLSMLSAASSSRYKAREGLGPTAAPTSSIQVLTGPFHQLENHPDFEHEPPINGSDQPSKKRLRHMYAGLSQRERTRLQHLPTSSRAGAHTAATVWAGAGAELLERKRKEDEKRKAVEERRRMRETVTAIGAVSWRTRAMQSAVHADSIRKELSTTIQEACTRGIVAPHCAEMHELPDVHTLQDRMSFMAVEAGLEDGVHIQAAAMMLAALEDHLRNIISSALSRVRDKQRSNPSLNSYGRLKMPDMAALLDMSPHVVVEPLGQGALERLLAPDTQDIPDIPASKPSSIPWTQESVLARYAQECATTKIADSGMPPAPIDAKADAAMRIRQQLENQRDAVRNRVVIDQLAPLRMLDRPKLVEAIASHEDWATEAKRNSPTTALGQALTQHYQSGAQHHHHHAHPHPNHRHKDEFFEVVDPVALLGELCE